MFILDFVFSRFVNAERRHEKVATTSSTKATFLRRTSEFTIERVKAVAELHFNGWMAIRGHYNVPGLEVSVFFETEIEVCVTRARQT